MGKTNNKYLLMMLSFILCFVYTSTVFKTFSTGCNALLLACSSHNCVCWFLINNNNNKKGFRKWTVRSISKLQMETVLLYQLRLFVKLV
jgi:hypothetical protein